MPFFTHKKRPHLGVSKSQLRFKIHIHSIHFKENEYFLPKSHYQIFRHGNKLKHAQSSHKLNSLEKDTTCVEVDDCIEFKSKLFQDSAHKELGRFMPKEKKLVLRQTTKIPSGDDVYADVGVLLLPLHLYANRKSGFSEKVEIHDPDRLAKGTVEIFVEHRPARLGPFSMGKSKRMHVKEQRGPKGTAWILISNFQFNKKKFDSTPPSCYFF